MTLDENDLRTGLRALTAGPPPAPPERARASVRRWRAQRLRRAGVATVTAFAVAVPVLAYVGRDDEPPGVRLASSPLAAWPDRREGRFLRLSAMAADQAAFEGVAQDPGTTMRWLYAGQVAGAKDGSVVAVWARCDDTSCGSVVVATGVEGSVDGPDFAFHVGNAADVTGPLGWYFPAEDGRTALFALGAPEARTLAYEVPGGDSGELRSGDGVFAGNVGPVGARPALRIADGTGRVLAEGGLGVGRVESVGFGFERLPAAIDRAMAPSGYRLGAHVIGHVTHGHDVPVNAGDTYRVLVRCAGTARATITTPSGARATVPCDGEVHAGPPDETATGYGFATVTSDDPYTVFRAAIAIRDTTP